MKKSILCIAVVLFTSFTMNAQRFIAGANAGIPVGDAGDLSTFTIAVELGYLFDLSEGFEVGPKAEYKHYFGDSDIIDEDISYLPIGGTARFDVADAISIGTDLGYAVAISDLADGGIWYQPFVIYDLGTLGIKVSYSGISQDGFNVSSINAGVEFGW